MKKIKLILFCIAVPCLALVQAGVQIVNPSFEEPGTGKKTNLDLVPGWSIETGTLGVENLGSAGHYAAAVTDGSYNLYASTNSWAIQTTGYNIQAGDDFILMVDASETYNATQGGTIELYYLDGTTRVTMGTKTQMFAGGATDGPYKVVLSVAADDTPACIGKPIGIRLGTTDAWVGFDNVRLYVNLMFWDGADTTADADGGVGTWDVGATTNWDKLPSGGVDAAWSQGVNAMFGGSASGVVTLGEPITAEYLGFDLANYTITSNTLTFAGTAPEINANQNATIASDLAGSVGFKKTGSGILNVTGSASGLTGTVNIAAGRLNLGGALGGSVVVADGTILGGESSITGDLQLGNTGTSTTRASLAANVDTTTSAVSAGNLTLEGITRVILEGTIPFGTAIPIVTYSGALTNNSGSALGDAFVPSPYYRRSVVDNSQTMEMTLNAPQSCTWTNNGGTGTGYWSLGSFMGDSNWSSTDTFFYYGDAVSFDDTAPGAVVLDASQGALIPASVTFSNTTGNDYTLSGAPITGSTGLTKNSTGKVTLSQANTYAGGTIISDGTLELALGSALGTIRGAVTVNGPGVLRLSANNATGYGTGTKIDTLNVFDGGLVDHVSTQDNGWGLTINLRGSTMQTTGGAGRFSFGGGTAVNTLASANSSVIAGLVRLREGNTGGTVIFDVEDGTVYTDLLISASISPQGTTGGVRNISKQGLGLMRLSGTNTYNGNTYVDAGCLVLDSPASAAATGAVVAADAGYGVLATGFTDAEIETLIGATTWDSSGNSKLVIDTGGGTVSVGANLAGSYKLLAKGGGVLNLSGTVPSVIETEDGTVVNVATGVSEIHVSGITTVPGTTAGVKVTIHFTAVGSGNIDVWSSSNLQAPGTLRGTVSSTASPFIDDNSTDARRFYILVPAGQGDPF